MNQVIIAAPSYNESVGGIVVLHKLCHILNELDNNSNTKIAFTKIFTYFNL